MNNLKSGDKIILLQDVFGHKKGTIHKIFNHHRTGIKYLPMSQNITEGNYIDNFTEGIDYKLIPKELPKTEIEWLDRIQHNFKEG